MFSNIHNEVDKIIANRAVNGNNATGYIMSEPGTEKIIASTSIADFVTCVSGGKQRYLVVHKDQKVKFNGQYCDSNGLPVSIITKNVFDTIVAILASTTKTNRDLKKELETTKLEKESLKMTIDTLRKNGVID